LKKIADHLTASMKQGEDGSDTTKLTFKGIKDYFTAGERKDHESARNTEIG
jgi:hypothetical protein